MKAARRARRRSILCALAVASFTIAGCEAEPKKIVAAQAAVLDRSTQALGIGALRWANGTYGAGCTDRAGNWSVRISGADPMDHAALAVVENDTSCELTLIELVADTTYTATPSIDMTDAYPASASTFASGGVDRFYANAKLSSATFAANFVVNILYSDDPNAVTGGVVASYVSGTATASSMSVTSPDYSLDLVTGALAVQVNANDVAESTTGFAILNDGAIASAQGVEGYIVDLGTLPAAPTFAELDAAYTAGLPTAIAGANPQVPAAAFGLVGVDITTAAVRTIVVRRTVSGVRSFQTFKLTFSKP